MSDAPATVQQLTPEQQRQQAMQLKKTVDDISLAIYTRMVARLGREFTTERGEELADRAVDAAICGANKILGLSCKRVADQKPKAPQAFVPDEGDAS